ncbi:hypothetical protein Tco_0373196 [Tanacetum coccineum]
MEFAACDLVWSKIEGHRDNLDRLALIPFPRVDDFVRGEANNKDCPTRFHVEARRTRSTKVLYKPKVDGILEYILYWCSFGPDDHRKGGLVRPSRASYVTKKKSAGRPSTKRGCTCHFIVKRLIAEPSVALIIYNQDKHVDKKGLPCHGPQDKHSVGTRAMYAPFISEEFRQRVLSLLHVGIPVETIMQRHNELVEKQGGPSNVNDLITHRHVRTQERNIRRSICELDEDDDVSVDLWVKSNKNIVFFHEEFSDTGPVLLGIQTEWQLQQMIQFGNGRLVALDSRFGTNKLKTRANLSKALGEIVKDISRGCGTVESFDSFMEDFVECKDFMDYFKAIWYPRIGSWITALKTMPIASLESSAALEFYHNQLKIRFLNDETDSDIYKRADWLVNKLTTKIHSYFWLDEYEGKDDFSRYRKDEWASDFTSWRKSRTIPNTDVITEGERVKVVDRVDLDLYHEIWNPGSEYAIFSCEWGENGNLCEHVCKVIQYHREKGFVLPSVSLLQYKQSLINMLKCPPANSSIRNYVVSLAVWVNEQLSAQFAKSAQNGVSDGRVDMVNSYPQMEIDLE